MTLQRRISLTSMVLIMGLVISSGFLFLRFFQVYQLKQFQLDCSELSLSLSRFADRNLMLYTQETHPRIISTYWMNDLIDLDSKMDDVFESRQLRRLGSVFRTLMNTRNNQWKDAYEQMVNPMIMELNRFTGSEMSLKGDVQGIHALYLELLADGQESSALQIDRIREHQLALDYFLTSYIESVDTLLTQTETEVGAYINRSLIYLLTTILAILLISLLISSRFSATIIRRINETNIQVQKLTEGSLKFQEDIVLNDEFDELVHDYHYFSQGLSDRLNSLNFLLQDIGGNIGSDTDISAFQETVIELGMDSISADAGMLFLVDSVLDELILVKRTGFCPPPLALDKSITMVRSNVEEYFESHNLKEDTPVFGSIIQNGQNFFVKDNEKEQALPYNADSYEWLFISSFVALPLIVGKKLMGILVFCNTEQGKFFSDLDFTFIKAYSDYTAQSIDNVFKYQTLLENKEIQKEIDVAATIQKRLLPSEMPDFSIGSAAIHSKPARGISGDYFDAIRLNEDKILYTVCDVAGKGVPASMLMIMIRTILHAICHRHRSANTLLKELNYHISGRIGVDQYATMAVFVLDEKKREISYANAAHHPLYLFRDKERQFRSFDTEGLPIGVDKNSDFGHKRIKMNAGDYLFLFTDGLPEARSDEGDELSVSQLLRFLSENLEKKPKELIPSVKDFIDDFAQNAKQHDDQTFLALKIH